MAKLGRKSKLTDELSVKFCKCISDGNYAMTACQYCNISTVTYYDWLKRGDIDITDGKNSIFAYFVSAVKEAEAKAITKHIANITKAANAGNWFASAWWLERKYPDLFGKRTVEPVVENKILIQLRDTGKDMLAINASEPTPLITTSVTTCDSP